MIEEHAKILTFGSNDATFCEPNGACWVSPGETSAIAGRIVDGSSIPTITAWPLVRRASGLRFASSLIIKFYS